MLSFLDNWCGGGWSRVGSDSHGDCRRNFSRCGRRWVGGVINRWGWGDCLSCCWNFSCRRNCGIRRVVDYGWGWNSCGRSIFFMRRAVLFVGNCRRSIFFVRDFWNLNAEFRNNRKRKFSWWSRSGGERWDDVFLWAVAEILNNQSSSLILMTRFNLLFSYWFSAESWRRPIFFVWRWWGSIFVVNFRESILVER